MRKALALLFCFCILATLPGCSLTDTIFKTTDELYALPRASEEYTSLQATLEALLASGLEYAPPLTGSNTQSVQLQDLDGDGENEAIAFFRKTGADDAPLQIYIFRKNEDGNYETACTISGEGTNINSVLPCHLLHSNSYDLVVSWQVSSTVYTISAYSLADYQPVELMTPTSYTRYSVTDLDDDGRSELILLTIDNSDTGLNTADIYDESEGRLAVSGSASLSVGLSSIDKVKDGVLSDGTPVLYVTGAMLDSTGSTSTQITDLLTVSDGVLCNITLNSTTLNSDSTIRYNLTGGQDINRDGVLEIPISLTIPPRQDSSPDTFYAIYWQQYDSSGQCTTVSTTYYNSTDGWYLELPDGWLDSLTLLRQDVSIASTNERGILFYQGRSKSPFMGIYKNTGANRESRAANQGHTILYQDSDTVYSLYLADSAAEIPVTESTIRSRFHLITTDWSAD